MKGIGMATDWRTVQVFLSDDGVFEVEADAEDYTRMRCTCSPFKSGKKCRHTKHVKKRIDDNGGTYSIMLPEDVSDDEVEAAMETAESFRNLIIKYAKVEVLE